MNEETKSSARATREYIGDAVYVDYDGYYLTLTTEDGIVNPTNIIHLAPPVLEGLLHYVERLKAKATGKEKGQ